MAAFKTHNLLPDIFRTETNKKFLNATLDQLVSEPNFTRVNGYIGRVDSPTYKSGDSYVPESSAERQHYQLEASTVVYDPEADKVNFYAGYTDLINKVKYYGGKTNDHSRLFNNEVYSFDGKFDLDKFVNYGQYYWLPNGPDAVTVSATGVPLENSYLVRVNNENNGYYFGKSRVDTNPDLTLGQGGVYEFVLDGQTGPFWIQTEPAQDGYNSRRPNVYNRDVFGVENNGASSGSVIFRVPKPEAQARYINMVNVDNIDYVSKLGYRELLGKTLAQVNSMGGLDGKVASLDNKKIIFANTEKIDDYYWTNPDTDEVIDVSLRTNIWITNIDNFGVVNLTPYLPVATEQKVFVKSGNRYASKSLYVNYVGRYKEVPLITSNLTKLYYQSGDRAAGVGVINIVTVANDTLDPDIDIIGKVNFTSANGIVFTNGLKIIFDTSVPDKYAEKTYIVEGVGKSIRLVPFEELVSINDWKDITIFKRGAGYAIGNVLTVDGGLYTRPAKLLVTGIVGEIDITEMVEGRAYRILSFGDTDETSGNFGTFIDRPTSLIRATISGTTMTIPPGGVLGGEGNVCVGLHLFGPGIPAGTKITALGTGAGGAGTYILNKSASLGLTTIKALANNASFIYNGATVTGTGKVSDGAITDVEIIDGGLYQTLPENPVITSGGIGTQATFVINLQPKTQEYSTINRGSLSRNAWSRNNRWFHRDVITATAGYLKMDPIIDQTVVAKRPIIEFDPDIKLFNYGTVASNAVDKIDNLITSLYLQVEGTSSLTSEFAVIKDTVPVTAGNFVIGKTYFIVSLGTTDFTAIGAGSNKVARTFVATGVGTGNGVAVESVVLYNNSRVIFNNDATLENRKKIFNIIMADVGSNVSATALVAGNSYEIVSTGTTNFRSCGATSNQIGTLFTATNAGTGTGVAKLVNYICTVSDSGEVVNENSTILVKTGINAGTDYWFNGSRWIAGQQKTSGSQEPLFDVFDKNNISFGDTNTYNTSTFIGTKVFSYRRGTGAVDPVLGFSLSYRNLQSVGDILYDNNFDSDTFDYLATPLTKTVALNTGNLHNITGLNTYTKANMWSPVVEDTKQYQLISHSYTGGNNLFEIDILPEYSTQVPNIKVSLNSKFLNVANFGLTQYGARYAVLINPDLLTEGDSVNIYIYSKTASKMGYYSIPVNLDNNSENTDFTQLTIGQLRNHLQVLGENSLNIDGDIIGSNNIRDTDIKRQVGNILKHSAPVIYSQLFLIDEQLNFVNGLQLAQKEYTKFKNKFLELSETVEIDVKDIAGSVDTIISQINSIKNISFPWYYSDMVPWGENKTTLPEYTVLELRNRRYDLTRIFNDTTLSNRAVLVYHTRTYQGVTTKQLLVKGQDYVFDPDGPNFRINDSFNLNYGDIITVVEYNSTDGNFIPETPTKLGLWPKYVPVKYFDNTYADPRYVIQGHDGSVTPAFGDYRDELLLELERRIYNNIKTEFRFDNIVSFLPGKFRDTEYTYKEYSQIVSNSFLGWVGNYRLDYTTNDYFESNNPWTWNYKNFKDNLTGDYLPGYWRGIYKYFFDTDRPHTHPWEMLGFAEMPDWWIDRYGTAPYTGGNINLWSDLSIGYIHAGPRKGIDKRYARPGLTQIIPVDEAGNLKSPESFIVLDFDSTKANTSYAIGDHGPIETAWRRSSDFPFAVQLALALMKPAEYFGKLADVSMYAYDTSLEQYIVTKTNKHLIPTDIVANGYVDDSGNIIRSAGYINWITDYLKNLGIGDPQTKIRQYLNYLSVQLAYKVGGYTDKNYLNILAEQSSPNSKNDSITVPDENYKIILNKSVPVNNVVYSAVIVEKRGTGYTVSGYNLNNPYFTIVPSQVSNNFYKITAGSESAVVYKDYQRARVKIPYGYEFTTKQQVVDFLVGYQRQLLSLGFVFAEYSEDLNEKQDWILSCKEFLTWAQQGWGTKNLIILSPANTQITFSSKDSVVDEITNRPYGSKLLNPNFTAIKSNSFTVARDRNKFVVNTIDEQTIAYAELNLVQYEHVIIFDNDTVFSDVIYAPESGNRQYRLKLVGHRTSDWTGALNPPGFVYNSEYIDPWTPGTDYRKGQLVIFKDFYYTAIENVAGSDIFDNTKWAQIDQDRIKTGLLPNYASGSSQFENFYDIDNPPASEKLNRYSIGITGFRERTYLSDLSLDTISQGKFYTGLIKQKGTKNAVLAMASARIINVINEVNVFEEWALRVGDYGATGSNEFVEVIVNEQTATDNPVALEFLSGSEKPQDGVVAYRPADIYKQSLNNVPAMFDPNNKTADRPGLPIGGYVNINDVDTIIYDLANYRALSADLSKIHTGYTIWTAKDFGGQWNVFRVNETNNIVISLSYNLDNVATVTTRSPHNLAVDDIVVIKNFNDVYNGFYQVYSVTGADTFSIVLLGGIADLRIAQTITGVGYLFKLTSSRVNAPKNITSITPVGGWLNNDKIWVDNLDAEGNWGVYNKTSPWNYSAKLLQDTLNTYNVLGSDAFGTSMAVTADGKRMFVGAPVSGKIIEEAAENFINGENYQITYVGDTDFTKIGATQNQKGRTFRANMALVDQVTGTTGTGTRRFRPGRVVVFDKQDNGSWKEINNLIGQDSAELFGARVLVSDKFLIVTAPGKYNNRGIVYIYSIEGDITLIQILVSPSGLAGYRFGSGIALSEDGQWLYISESATGKIYAYGYDNHAPYLTQSVTTNVANISLSTTASDLYIRGVGTNNVSNTTFTTWVPEVDYTISNISTPVTTKTVSISHIATHGTAGSNIVVLESGYSTGANVAVNQITFTGNAVLTNVASGYVIYGTGIPSGTTVTGVSGSTVTVSQNLTSNPSGLYKFIDPRIAVGQVVQNETFIDPTQVTYVNAISSSGITLSSNLRYNIESPSTFTFTKPNNFQGANIQLFDVTGVAVGQIVSGRDVDTGTVVTAIYGDIVSIAPHHRNFASGDYKFYNSQITFSPNITLPAGGVRIVRRPNYKLIQQSPGYTFKDPSGNTGTSFGAIGALSCNADGSQIIIGAPTTTAFDFAQAGKTYVYNRSIEKFYGDGVTRSFTTTTDMNYSNLFAVRVNGILQTEGVNYLIQGTKQVVFFTEFTPNEGTVIQIETNYFDKTQSLDGSISATHLQAGQSYTIKSIGDTGNQTNFISVGAISNQVGTRFVATGPATGNGRVLPDNGYLLYSRLGTFTTICPDSCNIYTSASNYKTDDYGTGAVYRYVNQGQTYGEITGTTLNPFVTPGHSIKINGVDVEFNPVTTDELIVDGVYRIIDTGYTNWTLLGASSNAAGTTFTANATGVLTEANIAAYKHYIIKTLGNTNWSAIGASAIATASSSGNVSGNLLIYGTITGNIEPGQQVFGANIPAGTRIIGQYNDIGSNIIAYPGKGGVYKVDKQFTGIISGPIKLFQTGQQFFANTNGNISGSGTVVATGTAIGLPSVVKDINEAFIPGVTAENNNGYLKISSQVISAHEKLNIQPGKSQSSPVGSTALDDLGLEVYVLTQIVKHPNGLSIENFGTEIKVSGDANQIAVASRGAATIEYTTFDNGTVTFDSGSMQFIDSVATSGAVYLYDLLDNPFADVNNPALMGYVQQLQGPGLDSGFEFGTALVYKNNTIYVGTPKDTENGIQLFMDLNNSNIFYPSGSVYEFTNSGTQNGWDLLRVNEQRTSVDSISKLYLYNKRTQQVVARLDVYDPAKGKILGIAEQDIDYKSEYDPATYNDSAGADYQYTTINELYHWGPQQVGKTWWDLSAVRYLDYEQSDLNYRNKYWGAAMPGSEFKVYEWVESTVLPSQYNASGGDGTVKYPNNENYVSYTSVDTATGSIQVRYYYWVADKASVNVNVAKRTNSSYTLQQILSNPKDQGIPYAAPIAPNAISLFNIANYLVAEDTVLHIDHSPLQNTNIIHNEYELFKEGDNSELPTRIINKLEDSLAGVDQALLPVPDPKLNEATRYGIELRPRQTMFVDRLTALENFVKFCNAAFLKYPIVDRSNLYKLDIGEPLPVANSGEWNLTVNNHSELSYLNTNSFADGYRVAVLADEYHSGHWVIYEWVNRVTAYTGNGSRTIYRMNALPSSSDDVVVRVNNVVVTTYTVDGRAVVFNTAPAVGAAISITTKEGWRIRRIQAYLTNLYWDKVDWFDTNRIDPTIKTTYTIDNYIDIEKLSLAEGDTVKVKDNGDGRFAWYIYENSTLDRVASEAGTIQISSTVYDLINNRLGYDVANYDNVRYDQYPVSEIRYLFEAIAEDILITDIRFEFNDLFFSMVNYIFSEQAAPDWIFKTSFITVLHKVRELLQYPSFIKNSETFYEDYINEVKPYRTQIREYIQKETGIEYLHTGATDFDLPGYYDRDSGTYRSPDGTIASDQALLETDRYADWNNNHTYKVTDIIIKDGGTGFNFIPNVTITGGGGTGAVAELFISNGAIVGAEILNAGTGYTTTPTLTINGDGTGALLTPVLKNEYFAANNKQSYNVVRSFDSHIKFDRVVDSTNTGRRYDSNVVVWTANTAYTANIRSGTGFSSNIWLSSGSLVAYGGEIYKPLATANTTQQPTFDRNLYSKLDHGNVLINGIDRVIGYYSAGAGMYGGNIELLVNSTEYPGVKVTGAAYTANTLTVSRSHIFAFSSANNSIISANVQQMNFLNFTDDNGVTGRTFAVDQQLRVIGSAGNDTAFRIASVQASSIGLAYSLVTDEIVSNANITLSYLEENDLSNYDAVISSKYLDTALGQRPEDINVDGGAYVDTYNSYGPEELLPGRIYDALDMQVFTANTTSLDTNVFYVYRGTISNVGFGYYYPGVTTRIYDWMYTSAASIVAGQKYEIITQGSIDYTTIGAPSNSPGTVFVATNNGYGGAASGNVFSVAHISLTGIGHANVLPVVSASNGAITGMTIVNGGYGITNPWSPNVVITGANYTPAAGNVYIEHDTYDTLGYRVFHTMNAPEYVTQSNVANVHINYHRISAANTTVLTQDFAITDSNIHVADASVLEPPNIDLAIPGRIFINGEKIHYFLRDTNNNVLGYLRRAVHGTGAPEVHLANTRVVDSGIYQEFNVNATVRMITGLSAYYSNVNAIWGNPDAYSNIVVAGNLVANVKGFSNVYASPSSITSNVGSPLVNGELSYDTYRSYFNVTGDNLFRTEESLLNVGVSTPADGLGLVASVNDNVLFMKQNPSYKP